MSTDKYFTYVYRSPDNGKILYAGYATDITRVHEIAHNKNVSENLGKFEILISGPYRDEIEARNVEAALISAIDPEWNEVQGTGHKFRPFGVPSELVIRRTDPPLSVSAPPWPTLLREALRVRFVPFPGGCDNRFNVGELGFPTELRLGLGRIGIELRGIAGATRRIGARHGFAQNFFHGLDDFQD